MSEEREETPAPAGGPAIRIEMTGEQFLAPSLMPKEMKEQNFYQGSSNYALGNFSIGHEMFESGAGWTKSWIGRITNKKLKEKIINFELLPMVVGQASRARSGATTQSLTRQTSEILLSEKRKKGIFDRLFGR